MKNPAKIGLSCQGKGKYGWLLRHISDVRFLHTLTSEADMERVILTPDDLGEILDWADDTPARIEAAGGTSWICSSATWTATWATGGTTGWTTKHADEQEGGATVTSRYKLSDGQLVEITTFRPNHEAAANLSMCVKDWPNGWTQIAIWPDRAEK